MTGNTNTNKSTAEQSAETQTDDEIFREFAQSLDLGGGNAKSGTDDDGLQADDVVDDKTPPAQTADDGVKPEASAPAAEVDIFADATPAQKQAFAELQARHARLEHSESSNRNRVSALTKKANGLEAQLAEAKKPAAADEDPGIDDEALAKFAEDFPEVFAAMKAMNKREVGELRKRFEDEVTPLKAQISEVQPVVQDIETNREREYRESQLSQLAEKHADYLDVQNSPEFWNWVETQTPGIQQLAGSVTAQDNIALLDLYKKSIPAVDTTGKTVAPATRRPRSADALETLPQAGKGRLDGGKEPDGDAAWEYWAKKADANSI